MYWKRILEWCVLFVVDSDQCQVYVNSTYSQAAMSAVVKSNIDLANLPEVPDSCRAAGGFLNCANYPKCVQLPRTNGIVLIILN
jgi:hypothetical protein